MRPFFFLFFLLALNACTSGNRGPATPVPSNLSREQLAKIHCGNCHVFPAPDLLDKASWEKGVLPEMAYRLGMRPMTDKMSTLDMDELVAVLTSGNYPEGPVLTPLDWQKIVDYYIANAPETPLPQAVKSPVKVGLPFFEVKTLPENGVYLSMLSMIKIDTAKGLLYACRREKNQIELYDKNLRLIDSIAVESPVSDLVLEPGGERWMIEMGVMEPNDKRKGTLKRIDAQNRPELLLDSLQRPVHLEHTDLNQDGVPDYLICQYGNETGRLAWYDGVTLEEHLLKAWPGARNTIVTDLNRDDKPDIIVLMCQSRERISIFYNRGGGHFDEEILLEFPPVYGSGFVDLADMNGDGHPDLLYTNGDNADYSHSLKRYHGLRIFLNDGQNHFAESWFYPIHGAGKVVAADFDQDGDPDLAAIAFFTDPAQQPNEGFLFFENQGNLQFEVSTFAQAGLGKWLVMDIGDLDRDGRVDIVLGSFAKSGLAQQRSGKAKKPVGLVWLRNIAERH